MMTYTAAIQNAICALEDSPEYAATIERLQALQVALVKRNTHKSSDATKAKQAAKRAEVRNGIVAEVAPIVFRAVTLEPSTAKEIFERCEGLPEGFTIPKVQYLLLHELAAKVIKIEAKGKPNTYYRI